MLGGLLALIFIAYLYGYCFFAAMTLASIGLIDMLPPSIFTIASLICLMTSIYHVDGALLHAHDDVILGALPLSRKTIVLSKIIPIYTGQRRRQRDHYYQQRQRGISPPPGDASAGKTAKKRGRIKILSLF